MSAGRRFAIGRPLAEEGREGRKEHGGRRRPRRQLRKRSSIADGRGRAGDGQTVTKDRLRRGRGSAAKSERRSAPRKTVRVGIAKNRAMPSFLPPLSFAREEATVFHFDERERVELS